MIAGLLSMALGGSLEGILVTAEGEPVEDGLVVAYDHRLRYELDYTDAAGRFRITGLKDGPRRLRIISPDEVNAVERYYDTGSTLCDALPVVLSGSESVDLGVVVLPAGGLATGVILGVDGLPIEGVEVSSRAASDAGSSLPRSAFTDALGRFEIRGIPVVADGPLWAFEVEGEGIPRQYLGSTFVEGEGEVFGIGVGAATEVGEWTLLPGGELAGTVVGPSGPVQDGLAYAITTGLTVSTPIVNGAFELRGLAPGEAQVWVEVPGLAATWYPNAPGPGVTVTVEDGARVDDLAFRPLPEAVLAGRFVGAADFSGSKLDLVNENRTVSLSATIAADGRFEVGRLSAGRWYADLDPEDGLGVVNGPLLDDQGNVAFYELSAGRTLDLGPVEAPPGAVIAGFIADRETGEGVYGARVAVENVNTSSTRVVLSGRGGRYRAEGLPAGVYRMNVDYTPYCDEDQDWASRHYPDQRNGVLTGSLALAPGQLGRWDPRIPQDLDHDAMGDAWERRSGLAVGVDDAFEDLDGDGFMNLDEYLLGTNPAGGAGPECGCSENGANWLLFSLPLWALRRRRPRVTTPQV